MKLFQTGKYSSSIKEIEVTRANDKSFWTRGHNGAPERRHARTSEYEQYFDTQAEAVEHVLERLERQAKFAADDAKNKAEELAEFQVKWGVVAQCQ